MEAVELKNKLVSQFNKMIEDDSNLIILNGIFDSLNTIESTSSIPEAQYNIIEKRREKRLSSETNGMSWEEAKKQIQKKYGF